MGVVSLNLRNYKPLRGELNDVPSVLSAIETDLPRSCVNYDMAGYVTFVAPVAYRDGFINFNGRASSNLFPSTIPHNLDLNVRRLKILDGTDVRTALGTRRS